MTYFIYILQSQVNLSYYIGFTENIEKRLHKHNSGHSRYTRQYKPWKLVYTEEYENKSDALKRELEIKRKKSKTYIEYLIDSYKGG